LSVHLFLYYLTRGIYIATVIVRYKVKSDRAEENISLIETVFAALASSSTQARAREEFDPQIQEIRPRLHRFCARMIGSAIDAEDVVQDTLAKAFYALTTTEIEDMEK
jgi:hypothetical protein